MALEHLWAGWRHRYVQDATSREREGVGNRPGGQCVFCQLLESGEAGPDNGIVHRGELAFSVLNAYPYASGHLLIMPVRHVAVLEDLAAAESSALWGEAQDALAAIQGAYEPDGLNFGANLGRAAGAGIPGHLHLHALPRWSGDTNFMTSVAGARVMPESLSDSWQRLHGAWAAR